MRTARRSIGKRAAMTEETRVGIAAVMLVPGIVAAIAAATLVFGTFSAFPLMLAALGLAAAGLLVYFAVPIVVFVALVQLSRKRGRLHPASLATLVIVAALSCAWFVISWSYGEQHQGVSTTIAFAWLNVATGAILAVYGVACRRRPSFSKIVLFHWTTLLWAASWAFPYLGEYP